MLKWEQKNTLQLNFQPNLLTRNLIKLTKSSRPSLNCWRDSAFCKKNFPLEPGPFLRKLCHFGKAGGRLRSVVLQHWSFICQVLALTLSWKTRARVATQNRAVQTKRSHVDAEMNWWTWGAFHCCYQCTSLSTLYWKSMVTTGLNTNSRRLTVAGRWQQVCQKWRSWSRDLGHRTARWRRLCILHRHVVSACKTESECRFNIADVSHHRSAINLVFDVINWFLFFKGKM